MYTQLPPPEADLSQGDIINNVVFGYVSISDPPLYDENGVSVPFDSRQPLTLADRRDVMVAAQKSRVVVLSQDCDCLSKPYIAIARLVELADFDASYANMAGNPATTVKSKAKHIGNMYQRAGAKPDAFYLQENADADLPKSVIAFSQIHSIETTADNLEYLRRNRIAHMNQQTVFDLQFRLALYFGRFATDENYMLTEAEKEALLQPAAQAPAQN